eukprot:10736258-Alexandrium_andersonii.AAC.1
MSASLVGSEMCIRDRRPCQLRHRPIATAATAASPDSIAGPGGGSAIPVSYTHLTLPTICSV